jgi:hypothetical protein
LRDLIFAFSQFSHRIKAEPAWERDQGTCLRSLDACVYGLKKIN